MVARKRPASDQKREPVNTIRESKCYDTDMKYNCINLQLPVKILDQPHRLNVTGDYEDLVSFGDAVIVVEVDAADAVLAPELADFQHGNTQSQVSPLPSVTF